MDASTPRVLSVQSHVVSGYVGNKCVTFPLQVNGFEVDTINSVQFSNHTGYPHWKGQVLKSNELEDLYQGLKLNGLTKYSYLLTGYVADSSFLSKLCEKIRDMRAESSNMFYICDPVMGDNGSFYVDDSLLPIYRSVISQANVITPNQFEAEVLTGLKVKTEEDIVSAISALFQLGPKMVVITSTSLAQSEDVLFGYGGELTGIGEKIFRFEVPRFQATFFGTGDVFTTLLLVWLHRTKFNLQESVQKSQSSIHDILKLTMEKARSISKSEKLTSAQLELRLVESMERLRYPQSSIVIKSISDPHDIR